MKNQDQRELKPRFRIIIRAMGKNKNQITGNGFLARITLDNGTYCALRRFKTRKEARDWAESQIEDPRFTAKWSGRDEQGS